MLFWNGTFDTVSLADDHFCASTFIKPALPSDTEYKQTFISTFIKDYFGDAVSSTNACRIMAFSVAQLMDHVTDNNDWNIYKDPKASLR